MRIYCVVDMFSPWNPGVEGWSPALQGVVIDSPQMPSASSLSQYLEDCIPSDRLSHIKVLRDL